MKRSYSTIVILNLFLALLHFFMILLFYNNLRLIQPIELSFENVELIFNKGRMDSIGFEYRGRKYSSLCRNLVDQYNNNLCFIMFNNIHNERNRVSSIKSDLIFKGFLRDESNALIIKEVVKDDLKFIISKNGYENSLKFWKVEKYYFFSMVFISFLFLNLFYFRRDLILIFK